MHEHGYFLELEPEARRHDRAVLDRGIIALRSRHGLEYRRAHGGVAAAGPAAYNLLEDTPTETEPEIEVEPETEPEIETETETEEKSIEGRRELPSPVDVSSGSEW